MPDSPLHLPGALRDRLKQIEDPEMGLSILDLGLIYSFSEDDRRVRLTMTLTSPTCPMGSLIEDQVREALQAVFPDRTCELEITFEPPWTPERMQDVDF